MNDIATDNAGSLRLQGISSHVIAQGLPEYPDPSMSRANEGWFFKKKFLSFFFYNHLRRGHTGSQLPYTFSCNI